MSISLSLNPPAPGYSRVLLPFRDLSFWPNCLRMTSGGASVPTVSGKTPDDQKKKLPDPVKVIKIVCDPADPTSGEKKPPAYEDQASFSWTHRYPAKLKAVLWNFTQNSAKLVTFSSSSRRPATSLLRSCSACTSSLLVAAIVLSQPIRSRLYQAVCFSHPCADSPILACRCFFALSLFSNNLSE